MHRVHFFVLRGEIRVALKLNTGTFGTALGLNRGALGSSVTNTLIAPSL